MTAKGKDAPASILGLMDGPQPGAAPPPAVQEAESPAPPPATAGRKKKGAATDLPGAVAAREQVRAAVAQCIPQELTVMGRPSTYRPEYAERALGMVKAEPDISLAEIAVRLGTSGRQLRRWRERHGDLRFALDFAKTAGEATRQRRLALPGADVNAIFGSKALDGYSDRPRDADPNVRIEVVFKRGVLTPEQIAARQAGPTNVDAIDGDFRLIEPDPGEPMEAESD